MRYYVAALLIISAFILPWFGMNFPDATDIVLSAIKTVGEQVAAVLLVHDPVTVDQLKSDYTWAAVPGNKKIRILVVPGHEPDFGGTEYGALDERDLNVDVADNLVGFLKQNPRYEVWTTRTKNAWAPEFANYFISNWDGIVEWQKANRDSVRRLVQVGAYTNTAPAVYHNVVSPSVGIRLWGINKWANENNIDIVIHIHFNDHPRKSTSLPGKYTGFSIYVPEQQYFNSTSTKAIANTVYARLAKYNPVSDLPGENSGIVEEPDLIAMGAYNSVDAASMLIEYAYIYEPQLNNPDIRPTYIKEIAYETYVGLLDFFDPAGASMTSKVFDTLTLPYKWQNPLIGKNDSAADIFALQTALILDGEYPPAGSTPNECPRTGKLGLCTKSALKSFQEKYNITGENDIVGVRTIDTLNRIYSARAI